MKIKKILEYIKNNDYISDNNLIEKFFKNIDDEIFDEIFYETLEKLDKKTNCLTAQNGESFHINKTKKALKKFINNENLNPCDSIWADYVEYGKVTKQLKEI